MSNESSLIQLKNIEILDDHITVHSFPEFDSYLRSKSLVIPDVGFTKIHYKITWENDKWYRGFYPLKQFEKDSDRMLSLHLAQELLTKAGVLKPIRMTGQEYMDMLEAKNKQYPTYSSFARSVFLSYVRS